MVLLAGVPTGTSIRLNIKVLDGQLQGAVIGGGGADSVSTSRGVIIRRWIIWRFEAASKGPAAHIADGRSLQGRF